MIAVLKTSRLSCTCPGAILRYAVSFLTDFRVTDWNVAHFWSLSTEEQFYLLWPALLVFAGGPNAVKIALTAMLVDASAFRCSMETRTSRSWAMVFLSVNAIATGCVLAGMRPRLHTQRRSI